MPKKDNRKRKNDKELEFLRNKLSKLEKKMKRKRRYESEDETSSSDTSSSSSSSNSSTASEHVERQQQPRQDPIENCLGVDPTQINTLGPEISENIALRWNSYLSTGLDKETKNTKSHRTAKLRAGLKLQNLIGKGLVAIEKGLSNLIEKKRGESQEGETESDADLVGLAEAGQIICLAHNTLSKHRQFQRSGHFSEKIKKLVASQTIDLFLFGPDFGDKWKNAKALQTTARELQAAELSTSKNSLGQASKKRGKTSMSKAKINQAKNFSNPRNNQYKRDRDSYREEKRKQVNKGSKYAGRIKFFMHEWRQITNNPLILDWVSGYKIPFQRKPVQFGNTVVTKCTKEMHKLYTKCIQRLQDIGAVKAVNSCQDQFLSSYLLRQKDNGEFRFILNLKKLNEFISSPHFRLEDIRMVKNLITKNCFLASVDLKDAYFLVPIFKNHRKYLRFIFHNKIFEFPCLPYGLATAPYMCLQN
nr:unnamed protein product [Callosobruchus chinensis]